MIRATYFQIPFLIKLHFYITNLRIDAFLYQKYPNLLSLFKCSYAGYLFKVCYTGYLLKIFYLNTDSYDICVNIKNQVNFYTIDLNNYYHKKIYIFSGESFPSGILKCLEATIIVILLYCSSASLESLSAKYRKTSAFKCDQPKLFVPHVGFARFCGF